MARPKRKQVQVSSNAIEKFQKLLNPGEIFQGEKLRGAVMSVITGVLANVLNVGGQAMGVPIQLSSFLSLNLIGNLLSYILDILFAKQNFYTGGTVSKISYTDFKTRLSWLGSSFFNKYFFRFVITVFLDTIIYLSLLDYTIYLMNSYKLFMDYKYRDVVLAGIIALVTFVLYVNVIRFDWAYSHEENPLMNVLIIVWLTLLLVVYTMFRNNTLYQPKADSLANVNTSVANVMSESTRH